MRVVIPGGEIVDMGHKGSPPVYERHTVPTYGVLPPEATRMNRPHPLARLAPRATLTEKPADLGVRSDRAYGAIRSFAPRLRRASTATLRKFYNTAKIIVRNP